MSILYSRVDDWTGAYELISDRNVMGVNLYLVGREAEVEACAL